MRKDRYLFYHKMNPNRGVQMYPIQLRLPPVQAGGQSSTDSDLRPHCLHTRSLALDAHWAQLPRYYSPFAEKFKSSLCNLVAVGTRQTPHSGNGPGTLPLTDL